MLVRYVILFLVANFCKVNAQIISTYAGTSCGQSGNGGLATSAQFMPGSSGGFDSLGNYYFAERLSNYVRKISPNGTITIFAGNGNQGFSGDGGLATLAELNNPLWVFVDDNGNVYIADYSNYRIRKVNPAGIITTIAGNGSNTYSGDGGLATNAGLPYPSCVTIGNDGSIYILDLTRIRKVNANGNITTIAGSGTGGFSGDGADALLAEFHTPTCIYLDSVDNIFIADMLNYRVRRIDAVTNIINTVVGVGQPGPGGDEGNALLAQITPYAVTSDKSGEMYIADGGQKIRKVTNSGMITTVVGTGVAGYSGDGGLAIQAQIHNPQGVVFDSCGNLYIAQTGTCRIRKVTFNDTCGITSTHATNLQRHIINIYPNPAYSQIIITASNKLNDATITNAIGQVVLQQKIDKEKVTINIAHLQPGIYFVTITDANGVKVVKKIVKE